MERLTFTMDGRRTVAPMQKPAAAAAVAEPAPAAAVTATAERGDAAFNALLVFTLVLFLRPQDLLPPLEALHLAEMSALFGLVALVLGRLSRGQSITRLTPEFVGVLAFGAVILGTAPFSLWVGGSIGVFTDTYAKVILVYLLAVNAVSSPKRLERLTWVLIVAVGYVAFRAVLDYARGVNMIGHGTRVRGSVGGIMGNSNDLALNMVAFVPLAAAVALGPYKPFKRLVAAACAVFMLGAVVASGSRGGTLGCVAMMVVLAVVTARKHPGLVVAGVLALMCALPVLPDAYWHRLASITDNSKDDFGSADARRTLIRESIDAYMANPLIGVGAGEFKDWNNQNRVEAWHEAHNVWLQVASELGTVGLVAFLFIVGRSFLAVYQTRRLLRLSTRPARSKHAVAPVISPEDYASLDAHSAAMIASLAGWVVCAFFASVAYNWTFYYLVALAATPRELLRDRLPQVSRARRTWSAAAVPSGLARGEAGV